MDNDPPIGAATNCSWLARTRDALLLLALVVALLAFWMLCVAGVGGLPMKLLEYGYIPPYAWALRVWRVIMALLLSLFALIVPLTLLLGASFLRWLWKCPPFRHLRSWQTRRLLESAREVLDDELTPGETIEAVGVGRLAGGHGVAAVVIAYLPLLAMMSLLLCIVPTAILELLEGTHSSPLFRLGDGPNPLHLSLYPVAAFALCLLARLFVPASPVLIGSSLAYVCGFILLNGSKDLIFEELWYNALTLGRVCAPYLGCFLIVDLFSILIREPQYLIVAASERLIVAERRLLKRKWTVRFRFGEACRIHLCNGVLESVLVLAQDSIGRFVCAVSHPESFEQKLKSTATNHAILPRPPAWQLSRTNGPLLALPLSMMVALVITFATLGSRTTSYAIGLWWLAVVPYDDFRLSGRPEATVQGCRELLKVFPDSRIARAIQGDAQLALDRFTDARKSFTRAVEDFPDEKKQKAKNGKTERNLYLGKAQRLANALRPRVNRQQDILKRWRLAYRPSPGVSPEAFRHYFAAQEILKDFDPLRRRVIDLRRAYRHARQACALAPSWREARELRESIAKQFGVETSAKASKQSDDLMLSADTIRLP